MRLWLCKLNLLSFSRSGLSFGTHYRCTAIISSDVHIPRLSRVLHSPAPFSLYFLSSFLSFSLSFSNWFHVCVLGAHFLFRWLINPWNIPRAIYQYGYLFSRPREFGILVSRTYSGSRLGAIIKLLIDYLNSNYSSHNLNMQIYPSTLRRALYTRREKYRRGAVCNSCLFCLSLSSFFPSFPSLFLFFCRAISTLEDALVRCPCDNALKIAVLLKRRSRCTIIRTVRY